MRSPAATRFCELAALDGPTWCMWRRQLSESRIVDRRRFIYNAALCGSIEKSVMWELFRELDCVVVVDWREVA